MVEVWAAAGLVAAATAAVMVGAMVMVDWAVVVKVVGPAAGWGEAAWVEDWAAVAMAVGLAATAKAVVATAAGAKVREVRAATRAAAGRAAAKVD